MILKRKRIIIHLIFQSSLFVIFMDSRYFFNLSLMPTYLLQLSCLYRLDIRIPCFEIIFCYLRA